MQVSQDRGGDHGKARMKAVGNQPACTLRRAGDGRAAPAHARARSHPARANQPAAEPSEPLTPAQLNKNRALDFVPIGWSIRERNVDSQSGIGNTPIDALTLRWPCGSGRGGANAGISRQRPFRASLLKVGWLSPRTRAGRARARRRGLLPALGPAERASVGGGRRES
jgi:hypothetical protein